MPSGSCAASHALALEVPGCHLHHILQLKQVTKARADSRREPGPLPRWGRTGLWRPYLGTQLPISGSGNWDKFRELLHPEETVFSLRTDTFKCIFRNPQCLVDQTPASLSVRTLTGTSYPARQHSSLSPLSPLEAADFHFLLNTSANIHHALILCQTLC